MKKTQILIIVVLISAVIIAYNRLQKIEEQQFLASVPASSASSPISSIPAELQNPETNIEFSELIHKEAESISRLNDQPDEVQKKLKELALRMQEPHVAVLQEKALNTNLNGDERFLSVYVLGESRLEKAQESLEKIASTPIPALAEARLTTQEEIIRGKAIESLREIESLKRVLSKAGNKFLTDRAQKTLAHREEGKTSNQ